MRTTLVIPDPIYEGARKLAASQNTTISRLVTTALDAHICRHEQAPGVRPAFELPSYDLGQPLVDIDDRDALYRAMEE